MYMDIIENIINSSIIGDVEYAKSYAKQRLEDDCWQNIFDEYICNTRQAEEIRRNYKDVEKSEELIREAISDMNDSDYEDTIAACVELVVVSYMSQHAETISRYVNDILEGFKSNIWKSRNDMPKLIADCLAGNVDRYV